MSQPDIKLSLPEALALQKRWAKAERKGQLLECMMPNGKKLGNCEWDYVQAIGAALDRLQDAVRAIQGK
jgi:hypothetical protein